MLELTLQGTTNAHYRVEFSDRVPGGANWHSLGAILLTAPQATIADTTALSEPRRFYRAVYAP